ncbi:MAG TPA: hypothetical protein VHD37_01500 [Candidatus Paceibacterota bacterium]|nr:hypothetical protein [Candidatus Paceibacterota bacterium]
MNIWFVAVLCAVISTAPLLLGRKFVLAAVYGIAALIIEGALLYFIAPSTAWPLFGWPGGLVFVAWIFATVISVMTNDKGGIWGGILPLGYLVLLIGTWFGGWGAFHSSEYATMIGPVEDRNWTQDVQPKDPRHMRMVSQETALYLANKMVGTAGAIGSQFHLDADFLTLQRVNGRLVYAIPFDYSGFSQWTSAPGVPAYIVVDAENPEAQPELKQFEPGKEMKYTPGAYFNHYLTRYLRNNGFVGDALAQYRFELDDDGNPHWVVSTYKPTLQWWGEQVTGVATVDPVSGKIERYSVADAPAWIDRIYPVEFATNYVEWWGLYPHGWLNTWWGKQDLKTTEPAHLIYGQGDKSEWVIGVTSTGDNDDSLVGLMYVDSRTGKAIYYRTPGGATDTAILESVDNNQWVKIKTLHGTTPQIYNVYGVMTAVVPLVNGVSGYQGVAFVPLDRVQDVSVGATQSEALREYQASIYKSGQQVALSKDMGVKELVGIVDRIGQDVNATGSTYLFHIAGAQRIFTASSGEYVKVSLTRPGDEVKVSFVASGEDVVPVQGFDNLSLPLDKTKQQEEVQATAAAQKEAQQVTASQKDLVRRIENMSPDEIQKLNDLLKTGNTN